MENDIPYEELIKNLQDPSDPLFGGSLAYMTVELSLSLLIKLMKIKLKKPSDDSSLYEKTVIISSSVLPYSREMITKDGEVFGKLRTASAQEDKDKIVEEIYPKSLAYLSNLGLISSLLDILISKTTSSLKNDYIMLRSNIKGSLYNLGSILAFEINKMTPGEKRDSYLKKVEDYILSEKIIDMKENS